MIKKINKNYTNFDSYEFAEFRRYPYPLSAFSTMPTKITLLRTNYFNAFFKNV